MREKLQIETGLQGIIFNFQPEFQDFMPEPHWHRELEMNLVIRGEASYELDERQYALLPGSLVWILPNQKHRLSSWSPDFSMDVVVFRSRLVHSLSQENPSYRKLLEIDQESELNMCRCISPESMRQIHIVCQSVYSQNLGNEGVETMQPSFAGTVFGLEENQTYSHRNPEVLNHGLSYILSLCWHAFQSNSISTASRKMHPAVHQSIRYIASNAECAKSVQTLATACGLSESRFSHLFKEFMGMTVPDYKNRVKLDRFFKIWRSKNITLTEACYEADFGSYAQFHKIFKKQFNASPREYLKGMHS